LGWAAVGVVAMALVAWLATRPGSAAAPTGGDLPTEIAAADLPAGLSLGTLVIPTSPTRLLETGSHVGQQKIDGLHGQANARYGVAELDGGQFLVDAGTRRPTSGQGGRSGTVVSSELYLVTPATGTARLIFSGFESAVPGVDGASVLLALPYTGDSQTVLRLSVASPPVSADLTAPAGRKLIGESVAGLVYESATGTEHRGVEVVNGDSVRYASQSPAVAVGRTSLAVWRPGEGLVVVQLQDHPPYAAERRVPGVVAGSVGAAQFSRDGRFLAIDAVDSANAHTVWVLELATGRWSRLPGTPVRTDELQLLWNSEAGVLAVTTGTRDTVLWRPGEPTAYTAAS
jgi:hypothetical protein